MIKTFLNRGYCHKPIDIISLRCILSELHIMYAAILNMFGFSRYAFKTLQWSPNIHGLSRSFLDGE